MRLALGGELDRLRRLKKVNDHVRTDEIQALAERIAALDTHISEAALRLDAVLLIVGA
jgi:ATP-dependent helicase HepA